MYFNGCTAKQTTLYPNNAVLLSNQKGQTADTHTHTHNNMGEESTLDGSICNTFQQRQRAEQGALGVRAWAGGSG